MVCFGSEFGLQKVPASDRATQRHRRPRRSFLRNREVLLMKLCKNYSVLRKSAGARCRGVTLHPFVAQLRCIPRCVTLDEGCPSCCLWETGYLPSVPTGYPNRNQFPIWYLVTGHGPFGPPVCAQHAAKTPCLEGCLFKSQHAHPTGLGGKRFDTNNPHQSQGQYKHISPLKW